MRLFFLTLFFALGMLSGVEAHAASDVLLPSDSNGTPNLGLAPSVQEKKPDTNNTAETPEPVLPSLSDKVLPFTPVPETPPVADTSGGMPTTVLKQPDLSALKIPDAPPPPANMSPENAKIYAQAIETLKTPYVLGAAFVANPVWTAEDVAVVNNAFGIAKDTKYRRFARYRWAAC